MTAFRKRAGVPVPPPRGGYPFADMKMGECQEFHADLRNRVGTAAARYKQAHPEWNYTIRRLWNKPDTCAIWRIKPDRGD